jgi:coxsackievirus/adenovirus receptor
LTYDSECELRQKSCLNNSLVSIRFWGKCDQSDLCAKAGCSNKEVCHVDAAARKASCKCPSCSEEFDPVCGTNFVTFQNECHLRRFACQHNQTIAVIASQPCDGCEEEHCEFYGLCKSHGMNGPPSCVCPDNCPHNETPVCGSDGTTYASMCELRRFSCRNKVHLFASSLGPCDVCDNVHCKYGARCERGRCVCPAHCLDAIERVCASDGKTYMNECEMRSEACKSQKNLRVLYTGICGTGRGPNPCQSLNCHPYQDCVIDRTGSAACACPDICPVVSKPVCGSDQITYNSECELRRTACLKNVAITVKFEAACDHSDSCRKAGCANGAVCHLETSGQAVCICPSCTEEYRPVCGSNSLTFPNECHLRRYACEHNQSLSLVSQRACRGCEDIHCEWHALCQSRDGPAGCVCPDVCARNQTPVCGSDGKLSDQMPCSQTLTFTLFHRHNVSVRV